MAGRVRRLIGAWNIDQANITFPGHVATEGDPLALYAKLRGAAGAGWGAVDGIDRLFNMVTCHFGADLSHVIDDDRPMIRWFINREKGGTWGSGVMVALGTDPYDRHSEEWMLHFTFQPDDPKQFRSEVNTSELRSIMRIPYNVVCSKKNTTH